MIVAAGSHREGPVRPAPLRCRRARNRERIDTRIKGHSYPQEWYEDAVGELLAKIGSLDDAALLSGAGSRRIRDEHRLVYLVDGDDLVILQARYHY